MMAFTTLFIAVPLFLILYFVLIKKIKSSTLNYILIIIIGVAFMFGRNLHLILIGLEIIIIGVATIFIKDKMNYGKKYQG